MKQLGYEVAPIMAGISGSSFTNYATMPILTQLFSEFLLYARQYSWCLKHSSDKTKPNQTKTTQTKNLCLSSLHSIKNGFGVCKRVCVCAKQAHRAGGGGGAE